MNKKLVIGMVAIGLALGGTTIVGASMNDNDGKTVKIEEKVISKEVVEKEGIISVDEAIEIALSEQDGYVESVELEKEYGTTYYEVDIEKDDVDYEIYIDALTGEVVKVEMDDDDWKKANNNKDANLLSVEQIKEIATSEYGGKVREVELDEDDGRYKYELELRTDLGEVDLEIDAVTGEILEVEID